MTTAYLTYDEQRLIAQHLYNLTDSLAAVHKLKEEYQIEITPGRSVELNKFARLLDQTKFPNFKIEAAILEHSGHKVDLYDISSNGWF